MKRKAYDILPLYSFKEEDDWGDYYNGNYRKGTKHNKGYLLHWYNCSDGKRHKFYEHVIKWEYFNGKIPEDMEIDHIIPIANGGTNKLSNLRLVTRKENANNELSLINSSESHKGQTAWNKGKHWGEETKKKIADTKEKIKVVQFVGNSITTYDCLREASRKTNISRTSIKHACDGGFFYKGRQKWINVSQAGGSKWMYEEDYIKMLEDIASQQLN